MRAWFAAAFLLFSGVSGPAFAEEGLFVARLGGGVTTHPKSPDLGGALNLSADLSLSGRLGVIVGGLLLGGDAGTSVGFGIGAKALLAEGFWRRLYLYLTPELLLEWASEGRVRADMRLRAGLGYEELLVWGTGLFVEAFGALPLGLHDGAAVETPAIGGTAGLFMEF
ncbi:MAG: hypothetical protein IT384_08810 [Deltaproteobacteria bacterium]|nr:hypothetical protein [Deltaproteobacteria bacterium]